MSENTNSFAELLSRDRRYRPEAYQFVFEALGYAQESLGMGAAKRGSEGDDPGGESERHLTGQELCEAIRRLALEQFGLMARCVLGSWGVSSTSDFGEIVYNLISINKMRKAADDRREDFNDVFDFESLHAPYEITLPDGEAS